MRPIITWFKSNLVLGGALVVALIAAVPLAVSAVRVVQNGKPLSVESLKEDLKHSRYKEEKEKHKDEKELRVAWQDAAGQQWLGTKGGLFSGQGGKFERVEGGPMMEVRGIAEAGGMLWTAGKDGVWQKGASGWKQMREGDYHGISASGTTVIAAAKKEGAVATMDGGQTWSVLPGTAEFAEKHHD